MPRDLVEAQGDAFGLHPVGTGPFRFAQWERGRSIVLAANPDYFDGAPRLGRLVYRIFSGENSVAMFDEFQKGQLEDSQVPTPHYSQVVAAAAAGDYVYVKRPMYNLRHYGLNTRIKPLDDRRVRLAIVSAIDRATILSQIYRRALHPGAGHPAAGDAGLQSRAQRSRVGSAAGARPPGPGGLSRRPRPATPHVLVEREVRAASCASTSR